MGRRNMQTKVIACEVLRREIEFIYKHNGLNYEITWIEPSLHDRPKILRQKLQDILDNVVDCSRVLLPFGECGNATMGIKAGNFEIILPKVDDCLTLLLGSYEKRKQIAEASPTYYLTLGWLLQETSLIKQYESNIEKFGKEDAKLINDVLFSSYKRIALIDTGIGDVEYLLSYQKPLKTMIGFDSYVECGTVDYLKLLLTGPWDDDLFYRVPPYTEFVMSP
jgi:hypothetical protein